MKKLFIGILAATMLVACNQPGNSSTNGAGSSTAAAAGPVMKFDKDTHDFGKIHTGDKITWDFKFTNTGKSPLIISDAVASCGCTIPSWPHTPVQPGQSGVIKVVFNSAAKIGLQDKQVTITANTNPAQNMVHLVGEAILKK